MLTSVFSVALVNKNWTRKLNFFTGVRQFQTVYLKLDKQMLKWGSMPLAECQITASLALQI